MTFVGLFAFGALPASRQVLTTPFTHSLRWLLEPVRSRCLSPLSAVHYHFTPFDDAHFFAVRRQFALFLGIPHV